MEAANAGPAARRADPPAGLEQEGRRRRCGGGGGSSSRCRQDWGQPRSEARLRPLQGFQAQPLPRMAAAARVLLLRFSSLSLCPSPPPCDLGAVWTLVAQTAPRSPANGKCRAPHGGALEVLLAFSPSCSQKGAGGEWPKRHANAGPKRKRLAQRQVRAPKMRAPKCRRASPKGKNSGPPNSGYLVSHGGGLGALPAFSPSLRPREGTAGQRIASMPWPAVAITLAGAFLSSCGPGV